MISLADAELAAFGRLFCYLVSSRRLEETSFKTLVKRVGILMISFGILNEKRAPRSAAGRPAAAVFGRRKTTELNAYSLRETSRVSLGFSLKPTYFRLSGPVRRVPLRELCECLGECLCETSVRPL